MVRRPIVRDERSAVYLTIETVSGFFSQKIKVSRHMSRGKSRIAKAESKTQFIREISGGRNFIYRPPKSSQIVSMAKKGKRESKTKVLILTSTQNLIKL
jgi:phage-related protein